MKAQWWATSLENWAPERVGVRLLLVPPWPTSDRALLRVETRRIEATRRAAVGDTPSVPASLARGGLGSNWKVNHRWRWAPLLAGDAPLGVGFESSAFRWLVVKGYHSGVQPVSSVRSRPGLCLCSTGRGSEFPKFVPWVRLPAEALRRM